MKNLALTLIISISLTDTFSQIENKVPHIAQEVEFITEFQDEEKRKAENLDFSEHAFNEEELILLENMFLKLRDLWEDKSTFTDFMVNASDIEKEFILNCISGPNMPKSEWNELSNNEWSNLRGDILFSQWELFIKLLQLESNKATHQEISNNLSYIENHLTLQHLAFHYKSIMDVFPNTSKYIKERNKRLIQERLSLLEKEEFVFYRSLYSKPNPLKSISIYHDNDVLTMGGLNQDREYTGGGELTLTTDFLNTRWLNIGWLQYLSKNNEYKKPKGFVMKYQSISIGAEAYTPYIRYKDYKALADTIHNRDRPFASVIFVEKSTYRLWPKGLVRNRGSWRVGLLGSDEGNRVQAALHRDAITESQRVYGWDKQIANGGRLYIQTYQGLDFLLFSNNNEYKSALAPRKKNKEGAEDKKFGFNLIQTNNLLWGGKISGFETGLRFSTANFKQISGENHLQLFDPDSPIQWAISIDAGIYYRYVHHNSLLEDFGYLRTIKDDKYDNEPISEYFFNRDVFLGQAPNDDRTYDRPNKDDDQLRRHLLKWDVGINLRFRRSTLFFRMVYYTKEYKIDANYDYISGFEDFYSGDIKPESGNVLDYQNQLREGFGKQHNDFLKKNFYAYGTLGMVWTIGGEQ